MLDDERQQPENIEDSEDAVAEAAEVVESEDSAAEEGAENGAEEGNEGSGEGEEQQESPIKVRVKYRREEHSKKRSCSRSKDRTRGHVREKSSFFSRGGSSERNIRQGSRDFSLPFANQTDARGTTRKRKARQWSI